MALFAFSHWFAEMLKFVIIGFLGDFLIKAIEIRVKDIHFYRQS